MGGLHTWPDQGASSLNKHCALASACVRGGLLCSRGPSSGMLMLMWRCFEWRGGVTEKGRECTS